MRRRGYVGYRDDVERAWSGADAGIGGSSGLITWVLVGLLAWRVLR